MIRGLEDAAARLTFSRVAGWLAHIDEQRERGRRIRPTCRYVGPQPAAA